MRILIAEPGVLSDAEAVGAPVSHQRCDALEEMKEAFVPQKEEINELDAPKQDEDEGEKWTWCTCFRLCTQAVAARANY